MSTAHIIAQLCMLATLILMITGKTPIYMNLKVVQNRHDTQVKMTF